MNAPGGGQPLALDYRPPGRRGGAGAALLVGVGGIVVGLLMIAMSLFSIAAAANALEAHQSAEQAREAMRQARQAEQSHTGDEPIVILVTAPPTPVAAMIGVGLCVSAFIINMAMGVVLVGSAAMLLRGSARAWPLHALWARAQLVAAVLAGAAWVWVQYLTAAPWRGLAWQAPLLAGSVILFASAWPIVLLTLMRRASSPVT